MSNSIHTALHHRLAVPSWVLALIVSAIVALCAIAVVAGSGDSSSLAPAEASAPSVEMPTSCVDASVVGHC